MTASRYFTADWRDLGGLFGENRELSRHGITAEHTYVKYDRFRLRSIHIQSIIREKSIRLGRVPTGNLEQVLGDLHRVNK